MIMLRNYDGINESTSVKIMTISAEVLLTEQRLFLTNQIFIMESILLVSGKRF